LLVGAAGPVLAFPEPNLIEGITGCGFSGPCHNNSEWSKWDCESCHGAIDDAKEHSLGGGYEQGEFAGPHSGFTNATDKCDNCHTVHVAPATQLLPGPTIVSTCFTCHDGTSGWGVYGAIESWGGTVGGGHSYESTNVVPGGDAATGGSVVTTFSGPGDTLICTDCHSPHGTEIVEPFKGDRRRIRHDHRSITSSRLLRQRPTGAVATATVYGSDWCAACHAGRPSGGAVHNHPVDSTDTHANPFDYGNVAVLASEDPTSVTETGTLGGVYGTGNSHDWPADTDPPGNRGFLMPYPRTPEQSGHAPICQQCHEDSRSVGSLVGDGSIGDAETADIGRADGAWWDGGSDTWVSDAGFSNPLYQNFPHETENDYMLVETDDDLCLNCHPAAGLP
jgi:predicted CXXCH cytochrome family protein